MACRRAHVLLRRPVLPGPPRPSCPRRFPCRRPPPTWGGRIAEVESRRRCNCSKTPASCHPSRRRRHVLEAPPMNTPGPDSPRTERAPRSHTKRRYGRALACSGDTADPWAAGGAAYSRPARRAAGHRRRSPFVAAGAQRLPRGPPSPSSSSASSSADGRPTIMFSRTRPCSACSLCGTEASAQRSRAAHNRGRRAPCRA